MVATSLLAEDNAIALPCFMSAQYMADKACLVKDLSQPANPEYKQDYIKRMLVIWNKKQTLIFILFVILDMQ